MFLKYFGSQDEVLCSEIKHQFTICKKDMSSTKHKKREFKNPVKIKEQFECHHIQTTTNDMFRSRT